MADPEKIAESKRRYDARKPSLGFRAPDLDAHDAIVAASTEAGFEHTADWLREAAAEKLARQQRAKKRTKE
jgi:hypothetical protein